MNILEYLNDKNIEELYLASNFFDRLRGLLGKRGSNFDEDKALLISPCNSIHTLFMKRPIDIAFVSCDGEVLKIKEHVYPQKLCIKHKKACAVIESFSKI